MLDVRSLLDPRQTLLLPLPGPPLIGGIAMTTRIGWLYSSSWALAFGSGRLQPDSVVTFSAPTLRYRRTVTAEPIQLQERCWVAEAEGVFATAGLCTAGIRTAATDLASRW